MTKTAAARNYGDRRIVEFNSLAAAWAAQGNAAHAAHYRSKATRFREQHSQDPYWVAQPEIKEQS